MLSSRPTATTRNPIPGPAWTPIIGVICFNTAEAGKAKINAPTSWKDLTKAEYKGKLVMPHPASSGTGYLTVGCLAADHGRAGRLEIHGRAA